MNGATKNKEYAASATTINDDFTVTGSPAFELIDIVLNFNAAPTTSENIVITSITPGSNTVTEYTFDPSTSAATSHVFRFDKRFMAGTTIGIDYTNTDTKSITRIVRYQENPSA